MIRHSPPPRQRRLEVVIDRFPYTLTAVRRGGTRTFRPIHGGPPIVLSRAEQIHYVSNGRLVSGREHDEQYSPRRHVTPLSRMVFSNFKGRLLAALDRHDPGARRTDELLGAALADVLAEPQAGSIGLQSISLETVRAYSDPFLALDAALAAARATPKPAPVGVPPQAGRQAHAPQNPLHRQLLPTGGRTPANPVHPIQKL